MNLCALPRCPTGSYAASDSLLCEDCIAWVVATLRDTEECIAAMAPVKPVRPGMVATASGFESASPAADHVLVMLDPRTSLARYGPDDQGGADAPVSVAVLGSWARQVWWDTTSPVLRRLTTGPLTVQDAVSVLVVHHRWITGQDWVCDYVAELTQLHRQVAAAIGDGPPEPVATCLQVYRGELCKGGVVVWHRLDDTGHHGQGGARCLSCRKTYAGPDLVRLRLAQREAG